MPVERCTLTFLISGGGGYAYQTLPKFLTPGTLSGPPLIKFPDFFASIEMYGVWQVKVRMSLQGSYRVSGTNNPENLDFSCLKSI